MAKDMFLHIVVSIPSELAVGKDHYFSQKYSHFNKKKCKIQWTLFQRFSGGGGKVSYADKV